MAQHGRRGGNALPTVQKGEALILDQSPGTYLIGGGIIVIAIVTGTIAWLWRMFTESRVRYRRDLLHRARRLERKANECARLSAEAGAEGHETGVTFYSLWAGEWNRLAAKIKERLRDNE